MRCFALKNGKPAILAALLLALAVFALVQPAEAARKRAPQPDRYASIVVDADTGIVLSEKNADKLLHPASLTKMMTLYLTFEAIQNGKLYKNQRLPVSTRAAIQEPSRLGLAPGGTLRVEDAILGLVTKSANDAAVVLAESIGGSESRFASLMTQKARQLGMRHTSFVNASGLHSPAQVSTARDMAILSRALVRHYPREYRYFSTHSFSYAGAVHNNHNKLMNTYQGMDGIKTGYVYASGYNLAASAVRDGRRLIGVIFGGKTSQSRNQMMVRLLNDGFNSRNDTRVASRTLPMPNDITGAAIPSRKPQVAQANSYRSRNEPPFNALGLVPAEQGDTGDSSDFITDGARPATLPPLVKSFSRDLQPRTKTATAKAGNGWAVQVGAFTSHDASMQALRGIRERLPQHITDGSQYLIAPLMTNRGMIYRARLSGLDKDQATHACRLLQSSCLILVVQ